MTRYAIDTRRRPAARMVLEVEPVKQPRKRRGVGRRGWATALAFGCLLTVAVTSQRQHAYASAESEVRGEFRLAQLTKASGSNRASDGRYAEDLSDDNFDWVFER